MKRILLIISIMLTLTVNSFSAGSSTSTKKKENKETQYVIGKKMIYKAKKYEKKNKLDKAEKHYKRAIEALLKHNKINPGDPDTLNYLGFAHRKIGDYKNAEIYYAIGLELDPTHIGINEYMGELFVVTNRMDLAKERLAVLKNCNCEEYEELKSVIEGKKDSKY